MFGKKRSVVTYITIITVIAFLLQYLIPNFTNYFMLLSADVYTRPWILVTHMFMHGSPMHLLFNMYALFLFGGLLEQKIGSKRFLMLYFGAGIIAGFVASFFYPAALGASGAIMAVLATLIVLMPQLKVLFFLVIPMPFWVAGMVWIALDVFGVFFPSGVGNIAHLVGMAIGLLYGFYLISKRIKYRKSISKNKTHMSKEDINNYLNNGKL
ncbi:MAG: rhomboid family intramembrane serine protease [archaeon]